MSTFAAVIICILSVIGLGTLIWSLAGVFLLPIRGGEDCRVHVVIGARGECRDLPSMIRALDWVADAGIIEFDTLLVDQGMDNSAAQAARLLVRREGFALVTKDEIQDMI